MKRITLALLIVSALSVSAQESGAMRGAQAEAEKATLAQTSAIPTSPLIAAAPQGVYEVCWYQQITRAATTSSSLQTVIGYNNGAAKTTSLASLNGGALQTTADATNTLHSEMHGCAMVGVAEGTDITYQIGYASTGATSMRYLSYVIARRVY